MKNKSKILLSIILAVIAVVAVAVVATTNPNGTQPDTEVSTEPKELLAGNYLTLEEIEKIEELVGNLTNEEIAKLKEEAANGVQDELTLRILLLLEDKIEITLAKDLEILAGMPVKGEKTLTGDATIKMFLGSNNNAMENAILEVERGATLHMNGLVLDGNGVCHAVFVAREATLNYLSGTIQYASSYGIFNQGTLNIEDGTFRPDERITREQFAKILVESLDLEEKSSSVEFLDVENGRWSEKYIETASKYLTGYTNNGKYYFRPTESLYAVG